MYQTFLRNVKYRNDIIFLPTKCSYGTEKYKYKGVFSKVEIAPFFVFKKNDADYNSTKREKL